MVYAELKTNLIENLSYNIKLNYLEYPLLLLYNKVTVQVSNPLGNEVTLRFGPLLIFKLCLNISKATKGLCPLRVTSLPNGLVKQEIKLKY